MKILSLQERRGIPELMDAPDLEVGAHRRALAGLGRLNKASRAAGVMAGPIVGMARREGLKKVTILDVGCGGGDVPVAVGGILRRAGVEVALTLMDKSGVALERAGAAAEAAGVEAVCVEGEAPGGLPDGAFDVVMNSLFLHHLSARAVVETLAAMRGRARRMVVVSDLRRSAMGWAVAWGACRALSRSEIVHFDGPASVQAAWTAGELAGFVREAGMNGARIERCWPWRMLLTWERVEGVGDG